MASRDDFKQANHRAADLQTRIPRAVSAHYDPETGRIAIHLSSKLVVSFSPGEVEGLENARPSQLSKIEISPSGFGIHFPAVDADLYVPGLFGGLPGFQDVDGVAAGSNGRPIEEKRQKGCFQSQRQAGWQTWKSAGTVVLRLACVKEESLSYPAHAFTRFSTSARKRST
jgi:hypothetical protein